MGKETKEKGKHRGKKITQFPTQSDVQEELEDAAMDRFLEITNEAYAKEIGDEFGKTVTTIFTDEPQFSHKTLL